MLDRTDSNYELRVRRKMSPMINDRDVEIVVEYTEVCCVPREPQQAKAKGNIKDFLKDGMLVK